LLWKNTSQERDETRLLEARGWRRGDGLLYANLLAGKQASGGIEKKISEYDYNRVYIYASSSDDTVCRPEVHRGVYDT